MEGCVYFPPKPALRFIPAPQVLHQLIFQAIMYQFPKMEAPEQWVKDFDTSTSDSDLKGFKGRRDTQRSEEKSDESPQRASNMKKQETENTKTPKHFVLPEQGAFKKQFDHPRRMNAENAFEIHYEGEEIEEEKAEDTNVSKRNSMAMTTNKEGEVVSSFN